MNNQEAFNKIWQHFVVNKAPPSFADYAGRGIACAYRGENGAMCAVGCLIPDEMYTPHIEGNAIKSIIENNHHFPKITNFLSNVDVKFLEVCQRAHDEQAGWNYFHDNIKVKLTQIASTWNLTIPNGD